MRTLHGYLLRRVAGALMLSMLVFTAVLMLASGMKDLLRQMITGQVPFEVVVKAFVLLAPYVVTFSLPMGLLASVLLVFGRFSADQEYTAARVGGVSLMAMAAPLLFAGMLLSGLAAFVNLELAPRCKRMSKDLVHEMVMEYLTRQPAKLLQEKEFITEIPGYLIRIGEQESVGEGGELALKDVLIHQFQNGQLAQRIQAASGRVRVDEAAGKYIFDLREVEVQSRDLPDPEVLPGAERPSGSGRWYTFSVGEFSSEVPFGRIEKTVRLRKDNELTFAELWRHWKSRGRVAAVDLEAGMAVLEYAGARPVLPAPDTLLQVLRAGRRVGEVRVTADREGGGHISVLVTKGELNLGDEVRDVGKQVHLHGQFAFSCACLGFVMLGIPLGLRSGRRETTVGIAVAILLVLVFHSFLLLGRAFVDRPEWHPELIVWLPAVLFQGIGGVMLWRANRG
jgi:lipopolysaccharide export LptBFGC system permease protein LptF